MKGMKIMIASLLISIMLLNSCDKKDNTAATGCMYSVRMTDAPGPYSAVNIDIQSVEVIGTNGTAMLNTHAGIYNVLTLANGIDTLIASGQINVGTVTQVRLILGSNNTLVADGITVPLTIPSGQESGLKINISQSLSQGANTVLLIDFDANQSIVALGNGGFHLKPVIRAVNVDASASGSITGHLATFIPVAVTVSGNGNTFSSGIDATGHFRIMGLSAGTYTVTITPSLPLLPATISNVAVSSAATADIGLVTLQ